MDSKGNVEPAAPKKMKFMPKAPPPRKKEVLPKVEKVEYSDTDNSKAEELLRRYKEASTRKPKSEIKSEPRYAFGHGDPSSMRSYGSYESVKGINNPYGSSSGNGTSSAAPGKMKEYKEPWDYYSNYPTTLPLRRPYSGNPEILDEEEFGEAAHTMVNHETSENTAAELGLLEENSDTSMFFLQLPPTLPLTTQTSGSSSKGCALNELQPGKMGTLLVYKSGKVKLKLGETLYEVSAGLKCEFAQDVVAINKVDKNFCVLGELNKRAVITPDLDSIISKMADI